VNDVPSPAARRTRQATWVDPRLLAGVLLILVSIVVGARVVSAADRSVEVYAAAQPLPAGHVIERGDTRLVRVRLSGTAAQYVRGTFAVDGKVLGHDVDEGELLARSVLLDQAGTPSRHVAVAVDRGHLADVGENDRVDVVATIAGSDKAPGRTWTVARGLQVVAKPQTGTGLGSSELHVVLDVPADLVLALTAAMHSAEIDIVRVVGSGPSAGDIGAGPVPASGSGAARATPAPTAPPDSTPSPAAG
jgi:hypothetical protein